VNAPTTYAEWAACCELLLKGGNDDEVTLAMSAGKLEWTSGVAERLAKRIYEVFDVRLKALGEQFQRDMTRSKGHETLLSNAMVGIRKNLVLLAQLSEIPALPEVLTTSLKQSLQQFVERTQASLEASARNDRTGRLLSIVKRTPVYIPQHCERSVPNGFFNSQKPELGSDTGSHPRRVILR